MSTAPTETSETSEVRPPSPSTCLWERTSSCGPKAGYLTPPFSPTSTSSDFIEGTNGGCGSGLGGADATAPQPRERTRDKLAKEVRKAKEKGKQKLLDSGGHNGYRRSAVVDAEGVEHDPECWCSPRSTFASILTSAS